MPLVYPGHYLELTIWMFTAFISPPFNQKHQMHSHTPNEVKFLNPSNVLMSNLTKEFLDGRENERHRFYIELSGHGEP